MNGSLQFQILIYYGFKDRKRERERERERERVWSEKNNIRMRFFQNIMCNQQRIFGRRARYVFYNNTFIFDVSCLYLD